MSVVGLGIDLVQVDRVRLLLERFGERALQRLLTAEEQVYCLGKVHPAQCVAARLAAKEAAFKALAQDHEGLRIWWTDLEVVRDADGRPVLRLHGRAAAAAQRMGVRGSIVSLTHERSMAAAVVVLTA
jgi:holo-[acyl-carrier protein] synthase